MQKARWLTRPWGLIRIFSMSAMALGIVLIGCSEPNLEETSYATLYVPYFSRCSEELESLEKSMLKFQLEYKLELLEPTLNFVREYPSNGLIKIDVNPSRLSTVNGLVLKYFRICGPTMSLQLFEKSISDKEIRDAIANTPVVQGAYTDRYDVQVNETGVKVFFTPTNLDTSPYP